MKLVDEIIDLLSSNDGSLTDALLKTKVLLHSLGHKELVEWVNWELNGYPSKGDVPPYRVLQAHVEGVITNGFYRYNSFPIPIKHLSEKQQTNLEVIRFTEALSVLEKHGTAEKGEIMATIPIEYNSVLSKPLSQGYYVERAWSGVPVASLASIFVQVRSRLLDFVLSLRDKLPTDAGDSLSKAQVSAIDAGQMFKSAIFGDNTTIVVGSHNVQTVTGTIVRGDFDSLASALRKSKVSELDVASLKSAIDADEEAVAQTPGTFGPRVKAWLETMWSKAVDASWQIELGVAGSLLAQALTTYYGW